MIDARRGGSGIWVGRERELAVAGDAVRDVAAGRGGVLVVEGEPGIGKSALVARAVGDAITGGCQLRHAVADPLTASIPLQVVDDLLTVRRSPAEPMPRTLGDPVAARSEQLLARVDELCAVAPTVLVLDDLQWLDEAGLVVWSRLVAASAQMALLLVATCRPLPRPSGLSQLLRVVRGAGGTVLDLAPLPGDAAAELAGRLCGAAAGPGLRERIAAAGGNPLYVEEMVGALVRHGDLMVAGGVADVAGPPRAVTLPGAIAERLDFLSGDCREVLRLASLLDRGVTVAELLALTGRTAVEIVPLVDEALGAGVLLVNGEQLAFRHGLIRDSLLASVPIPLRSALHGQAARALVAAGAAPERVAAQLLGADVKGNTWVARWLVGLPVAHLPTVVVELLGRVLAGVVVDDALREELQARLVTSAFRTRAYDVVQDVAPRLLAGAPAPERAADITWMLGYAYGAAGREGEAMRLLEDAVVGFPRPWPARLRALLAMVRYLVGDLARAAQLAEEAHDGASGSADPMATGYACHVLSLVAVQERRTRRALGLVDEALTATADEVALAPLRVLLLANRASWSERAADAEASIAASQHLATLIGTQPMHSDRFLGHLYTAGRWDDAQAEADAVLADSRVNLPAQGDISRGVAALIGARRGRSTAALAHGPITGSNRPNAVYVLLARAVLAELAGELERAARVLAGMLDDPDFAGHRHLWIARAVRTALAARDPALAGRAAAVAADDAGADDAGSEGLRGTAARWAAALLSGDLGALDACVDAYRESGFLTLLADVSADAALAAAAAGDPAGARRRMGAAATLYTELGADWELRRADSRLRALGVRRRASTATPRPLTGWGALTRAESRVAELVAEGRSNPAIAAALFLSRSTVQTHVSAILAKLGVASRTEVARSVPDRAPSSSPC